MLNVGTGSSVAYAMPSQQVGVLVLFKEDVDRLRTKVPDAECMKLG